MRNRPDENVGAFLPFHKWFVLSTKITGILSYSCRVLSTSWFQLGAVRSSCPTGWCFWFVFLRHLVRILDYPYLDFSWFSSVRTGKCQDNASNSAKAASFHILPYSLFRSQSTIRRYIFWATCSCLTQIANKKVQNFICKLCQLLFARNVSHWLNSGWLSHLLQ